MLHDLFIDKIDSLCDILVKIFTLNVFLLLSHTLIISFTYLNKNKDFCEFFVL